MKPRTLLAVSLLVFFCQVSIAQGRDFIREKIKYYGECKNVAITKTNGNLMLYGKNGWAGTGLPSGLSDALHEINSNNELIDDVQLTENGSWLILIGDNGFQWNDIPYSLERKIREWNSQNEVVTSVTFNDAGQWVAVSRNYISASEQWIQDWLVEGGQKYGTLWAVCITNDAMVACYESGYKYYGEVPETLKDALKNETRNVFRIKIAGTSWFYADESGSYRYYM